MGGDWGARSCDKCHAVKALAAEGKDDEAIALAESLRGPWTPDRAVDRWCEQILLKVGRVEEAYRRFGLAAHAGGTYLAKFRAVAAAYPGIARERILRDLIQQSPGDEGKWFTAAKELGMYGLALELVRAAITFPPEACCAIPFLTIFRASTSASLATTGFRQVSPGGLPYPPTPT